MVLKKIVSFGFKFRDKPNVAPGVVVVDVRGLFQNPYRALSLRAKDGRDVTVQDEILKTPNFMAKYAHVKAQVTAPGTEVAYVGCYGGYHRSVFLAERLGRELGIPVEHRDLDRQHVYGLQLRLDKSQLVD